MQTRRNERTIDKAFSGLIHNKHQHLIAGLKGLLEDAIKFIYEQHIVDGHTNHLEYGDTYGWAIYYNGVMLEKKINTGPYISDFSVSDELSSRIAASSGYVGIVMAGMNPTQFFWHKHEIPYMELTMDMIASEFYRFFEKV